jgi:hypothetical protein
MDRREGERAPRVVVVVEVSLLLLFFDFGLVSKGGRE